MKYAVNTNFLKNKYNPKEIIEQALLAEVQGIEWGLGKVETAAADAKEATQLANDAGLEVFSFINGGKLWHKDDMLRWSEAVASAGAKMLRVSHPWFGYNYDETMHQPETFPALMDRAREGLANLEEMGRQFGLRYLLETHSASCFASPMTVLALRRFSPDYCGFIYDVTNSFMEGFIRPRGAVELMGPYMAYVHVKNRFPVEITEPNGKTGIKWERRPLNKGCIDWEEVMFALKLVGFDGWMSFEEPYTSTETFAAEIREGVAHLKECEAKAPSTIQEPFTHLND